MRKAKNDTSIEAVLENLQDAIAEKIGGHPLLKQQVNVRVLLEMEKPSFNVCLEPEETNDLRRRAALLHTSPETLIKNLILEYLYDFDCGEYADAS